MKKLLFVATIAVLVAACADKFQTARTSVRGAQLAVTLTDIGFQAADSEKQKACNVEICAQTTQVGSDAYAICMKQDHSGKDAWVKCYAKMKQNLSVWAKIKKLSNEALGAALAIIDLAEQQKSGKTIDWFSPFQRGVCLLKEVLNLLPEKYREKIEVLLLITKVTTCPE